MDYINYYNDVRDDSILKENENNKGFINDREIEYDPSNYFGLTNASRTLSDAKNNIN